MVYQEVSPREPGKGFFVTTRWSVVLAAGHPADTSAKQALSQLCEAYWYPLYAYARRVVGDEHEAQDLTQSFFAHLLERQAIAKADRSRGRFRSFLLTALKNFLVNQWNKARAQKRGGGEAQLSLDFVAGESRYRVEPSHHLTAEALYEQHWVRTMLDQVLEGLRSELAAAGQAEHFEQLKHAVVAEMTSEGYEQAGLALGITPGAAKQAAYRLRRRYRQRLREEVARTVASESEVDDEITRLLEILGR
jgi:RNA polymerase sigma-70 factor (ECF subfamily)